MIAFVVNIPNAIGLSLFKYNSAQQVCKSQYDSISVSKILHPLVIIKVAVAYVKIDRKNVKARKGQLPLHPFSRTMLFPHVHQTQKARSLTLYTVLLG